MSNRRQKCYTIPKRIADGDYAAATGVLVLARGPAASGTVATIVSNETDSGLNPHIERAEPAGRTSPIAATRC